jgi:hypothetical protein
MVNTQNSILPDMNRVITNLRLLEMFYDITGWDLSIAVE